MLRHSRILIEGCRILDIPIVWLEQLPDKLGDTHPLIAEVLNGLSPIAKSSFSALGNDKFVKHIERNCRKQIILSGIETHICVYQTIKDLKSNFKIHVPFETVGSRNPNNYENGLDLIRDMGASVTNVETILFDLIKTSEHSSFKVISKLIK